MELLSARNERSPRSSCANRRGRRRTAQHGDSPLGHQVRPPLVPNEDVVRLDKVAVVDGEFSVGEGRALEVWGVLRGQGGADQRVCLQG